MNKILANQLALDYCCTAYDVCDSQNHFTEYTPLDGRRRFVGDMDCDFKITAVNSKLLFTGRKDIITAVRERYENRRAEWFFEANTIIELNSFLNGFDAEIKQLHPFYISETITEPKSTEFDIRIIQRNEIEQFRDDERFDEAFCFDENTPDMLGAVAVSYGEIIGMAGASADSPYMWQIGINVDSRHTGRGLGGRLVAILKNEILKRGLLPYYGTSLSHLASQRLALSAGFVPAWVEMTTRRT